MKPQTIGVGKKDDGGQPAVVLQNQVYHGNFSTFALVELDLKDVRRCMWFVRLDHIRKLSASNGRPSAARLREPDVHRC